MESLLLPLRYTFRECMPAAAIETPTSQLRLAYDGITYALLNRCGSMQLHPAEAMAILYAVLSTSVYGGAPVDFWNRHYVRTLLYRGLVLRHWMHEHSVLFSVEDLRGCMSYCYPTHGVHPPLKYTVPCTVRYGERAYSIIFERAETAMAFISVYLPPLCVPRTLPVVAENAHPLSDSTTVWFGRTWDTVIPLAVGWRVRMQDYAYCNYEQFPNYDYTQLELF
jgi:hypothetical protein